MLKYAAAFVLSTGVLVYFIAPVSEEPQAQPATVAEEPAAKPTQKVEAEYWGDDAVDEDFVFGEPVKYNEPSSQNNTQEVIEKSPSEKLVDEKAPSNSSTITATKSSGIVTNYKEPNIKTPKPGEPGSRENPIDMTPTGGRSAPE